MRIDKEINKFDNEINYNLVKKQEVKEKRPKRTPEEIKEYHRQYYLLHRDEYNRKLKEYRDNNREKYNTYHREYNNNNKDKIKEYNLKIKNSDRFEKRKQYMKNYLIQWRDKNKRQTQINNRLYYLSHKDDINLKSIIRYKLKNLPKVININK